MGEFCFVRGVRFGAQQKLAVAKRAADQSLPPEAYKPEHRRETAASVFYLNDFSSIKCLTAAVIHVVDR